MRFLQHLDPLNEIRFIREMRVFIVFGPSDPTQSHVIT